VSQRFCDCSQHDSAFFALERVLLMWTSVWSVDPEPSGSARGKRPTLASKASVAESESITDP